MRTRNKAKELLQNEPDSDMGSDEEVTEAERTLREYIGTVILQVFQRCSVYRDIQGEDSAWHKKRLLNLIMDELPKDLAPDVKPEAMAQAVHEEMCRVFVKKPKRVIRSHYPHVPPVCEVCAPLVECFHCKLKEHSGAGPSRFRWRYCAAVWWGVVLGVLITVALQLFFHWIP